MDALDVKLVAAEIGASVRAARKESRHTGGVLGEDHLLASIKTIGQAQREL